MTHELFSYDEADAILRLDGANDYVGISAIDGLIASVVAGPAAMEPSVWLPEVFGKTPLQTPGTPQGAVRLCVGIDFRAISRVTKLPDHAARSII